MMIAPDVLHLRRRLEKAALEVFGRHSGPHFYPPHARTTSLAQIWISHHSFFNWSKLPKSALQPVALLLWHRMVSMGVM